jgi:hypothetical protein
MAVIKSFNRGVRKLIIATWTAGSAVSGTYGPAYQVLGVRQANLSWVVSSDKARGDDVDLDTFTKITAVSLTIAQATVDTIVANMILGGTLVSNATYYDLTVGDSNDPPYFSIAYDVYGSNNAGDLHVFIPKAKLSATPQFNAQVDQYLFPQMQFEGVYEGTLNNMMRMRHYTGTASALSIPLATT